MSGIRWLLSQSPQPDLPMSVMVPPPPQTGLEPRLPPSAAAFSGWGRSQGPALTLTRVQGPCQWGGLGPHSVPPRDSFGPGSLSACASSNGKPSQRDHSGPSQLCLIHPLLPAVPLAQGSRKPKPHGLRTLLTFPSASEGLKPWEVLSFLPRIDLVLKVGKREFRDLGL